MTTIKYLDKDGFKYALSEFLERLDLRFAEINHTHTASDITDFATEVNKLMVTGGSHTHANLTVLDGITEAKVAEWNKKIGVDDVEKINYTHTNMSGVTNVKGALDTLTNSVTTLVVDKVNKADVIDNLISTNVDKPLSANQGKILKDDLTTLSTTVGNASSGLVKQVADLEALNAEENVQSDWNEIDISSDAFIKNKPEVITTTEIDAMMNEIFI